MEDYILFNDVDKYLTLVKTNERCSYDKISSYHYTEEKGSMSGGIGRAFSAGIGSGKGTYTLRKMYISIEMNDKDVVKLQLLITPTNSNTIMYKQLYKTANKILTKLEEVVPKKTKEQENFYDELIKLKKLYDLNIITEQEYNLKKKQILNK